MTPCVPLLKTRAAVNWPRAHPSG